MDRNETKLKAAGIRMALKLLPTDLLQKAPEHLENFLKERLEQVKLEAGEQGACYIIAPHPGDGHMRVITCTLDYHNTVKRLVSETTIAEIFASILENMKEM